MRNLGAYYFTIFTGTFFCYCAINNLSLAAQVLPDVTLPVNSNVTVSGSTVNITGGTIAGNNLFHSFQQFSVLQGSTAQFANPTNIQNIIARVTGTSPSQINGTVRALNSANLFLINPNGIVFGSNARLDIKGAFVATTANALSFGASGSFGSTTNTDVTLLRVNPSAFLFNQITPVKPISSQATLQVPTGTSLLLVGGNLTLNGGGLVALGGRVELASVAETGTIGLNLTQNNLSLNFPQSIARGNVSLINGAQINVRGAGGGNIAINTQSLNMSERSIIRAGIDARLGSSSSVAGNVDINATGDVNLSDRSFIANALVGTGKGGNVNIAARSLFLSQGAQLVANTVGQGNAGIVTIQAADKVSIDGVGSTGLSSGLFSTVEVGARGNGGGISINARSVSITNGAQLQAQTSGQGDAGNITIRASDRVLFDGVTSNGVLSGAFSTVERVGVGKGGNIDISAQSMSVTNGAELQAKTRGRGDAGNVLLNVVDTVTVSGVAAQGFSSALLSNADSTASGRGGLLSVQAGTLQVRDGGVLAARSANAFNGGNISVNVNNLELTGGGELLTSAFSSGSAGSIIVNANNISISGSDPTFAARLAKFGRPTVDPSSAASGIFANTETNSTGSGGNIVLETRNLSISDNAGISVDSRGTGNGGSLVIKATNSLLLQRQAFLLAGTASGEGGNIGLDIGSLLLIRDNSLISTTAGGSGNGGDININSPFVVAVLSENSDIRANAFKGRGGNINITTQNIFGFQFPPQDTLKSDITASSEFGVNGNVQINTPGIDPAQGITELPSTLIDASSLVASSCRQKEEQGNNKFVVTGRGGLPYSPTNTLSNETVLGDFGTLSENFRRIQNSNLVAEIPIQKSFQNQQEELSKTSNPIVEAQGWEVNERGQVVLAARARNVIPHSPWLTTSGCSQ